MKRVRKSGFILSLVIVALGLLGVVMAVLGQGTNTMLFHANRAYLRAVERNLTASGLAWTQYQVRQGQADVSAEPVRLDIGSLHIRQGTLAVSFVQVGPASVDVRVEATCAKGRRSVSDEHNYAIELAP